MPHYDYQCQVCGHTFEVFQSMNAEKLTDCPQENCSGQVKRLLGTGAGIVFKGSGFYETDFKEKKQSPKKEGESADSSTPEKKTTEKKTTSPTEKSPTKTNSTEK